MSYHNHTFQCFDFIGPGHKAMAASGPRPCLFPQLPRHGMIHQEPPQACCLCADHWRAHHLLLHQAPELDKGSVEHFHIHHKKVVLVKNSDPSFRRSIALHRRPLQCLGLFLEEVSELLQYHVTKLYTLEGRKIDSVQKLLHCPAVIVCVGPEPSHPVFLENFPSNSDERLPRLDSRSPFVNKQRHESKTNETKTRTRSKSGHRNTARQSISSDKSLPNGTISTPPEDDDSGHHPREALMEDDIEKRVLVNKDGSLSMEMKVRFRLLNDETLHWSTEIRRSLTNTNQHLQEHNEQPCCLESCSESESISTCETKNAHISKFHPNNTGEPHCPHCCTHCQEYDIWKNPFSRAQGAIRQIKTSSSSASSHTMVCKKSVQSMSSEEYVVEKETCYKQTVEEVDTTIEYCTIRSDMCPTPPKCKSRPATVEQCENVADVNVLENNETRPASASSVLTEDSLNDQVSVQITEVSEEDERPTSAISISSQILMSLKEDQDDEEDVLSPRPSRVALCSQNSNHEAHESSKSTVGTAISPMQHLSPRQLSRASVSSVKSGRIRNSAQELFSPAIGPDDTERKVVNDCESRSISANSNASTTSKYSKFSGVLTPEAMASNDDNKDNSEKEYTVKKEERAFSSMSTKSNVSTRSRTSKAVEEVSRSSSAMSVKSDTSGRSSNLKEKGTSTPSAMPMQSNALTKSEPCVLAEIPTKDKENKTNDRAYSGMSAKSNISHISKNYVAAEQDDMSEKRANSAMSAKSNVSTKSRNSNISDNIADESNNDSELPIEQKASNAMPTKSNNSVRSKKLKDPEVPENEELEKADERAASQMSAQSNVFIQYKKSRGSEEPTEERAASALSARSNVSTRSKKSKRSEDPADVNEEGAEAEQRAASVMSARSNLSARSEKSRTSDLQFQTNEKERGEAEERPHSAVSAKSNVSARSKKSKPPEVPDEGHKESEERALSVVSAKSNVSTRSRISNVSNNPSDDNVEETTKHIEERAPSALSTKSNVSARSLKSKGSGKTAEKHTEELEESEIGARSAMSVKSNVSARSGKSNVSGNPAYQDNEDAEERAASVLSIKSNLSTRPAKNKRSEDPADVDEEGEEAEQRAASVMSARSNLSARSEKSRTSDLQFQTNEKERGEAEERPHSAVSAKSNVSARSKKSKPPEVPDEGHKESEERALSVVSAKSNVSTRSRISNVSNNPSDDNVEETTKHIEERAPSALSTKSNVSARSLKSKGSGKTAEKHTEELEESEIGARSAMSVKSNVSARSGKSNVSGNPAYQDNEDAEERAASVLSIKSNLSTRPAKNKRSEDPADVDEEGEEAEQRASSVMSARSNVSTQSRKSRTSDIQFQTNEKEQGAAEERPHSAVSAKSNVSTRSKKSKPPEVPDEGRKESEESEERALSVVSAKSNVSARSRITKVSNNPSDDNVEETTKHIEERAPSALSAKSHVSVRSKKSEFPEIPACDKEDERGEAEERAHSAMSAKSHVSTRSRRSTVSDNPADKDNEDAEERAASVLSNKSNLSTRSKKSTWSEDPADVNEEGGVTEERASSVMSARGETEERPHSAISAKSNVSARSKKSKRSEVQDKEELDQERTSSAMSTKSKVSTRSRLSNTSEKHVEENTGDSKGPIEKRANSTMSEKSNSSARSNKSKPLSFKKPEDTMKDSAKENEEEEGEEKALSVISARSHASVTSRRSQVHEIPAVTVQQIEDREPIDILTASNGSARSRRSKLNNNLEDSEERPPSNLSAKSKMSVKSTSSNVSDSPALAKIEQRIPNAMYTKSGASSQSTKIKSSNNKEAGHTEVKRETRPPSSLSVKSNGSAILNKSQVSENPSSKDGQVKEDGRTKSNSSAKSMKSTTSKNPTILNSDQGEIVEREIHILQAPFKLDSEEENTLSISSAKSKGASKAKCIHCHSEIKQESNVNISKVFTNLSVPGENEDANSDNGSSRSVLTNESSKKLSFKKDRISHLPSQQIMNNDVSELIPSSLPNASPNDVVNEWLKKIPTDSTMYDVGEEINDNCDELEAGQLSEEQIEKVNGIDLIDNITECGEQDSRGTDGNVANNVADSESLVETKSVLKDDNACKCLQRDDASKSFHSSVQVMKVLLSPKLDRCNSLPQVSPVYGRKLSSSARGLLDCLAKLQLIDFDQNDEKAKDAKYQELMNILQSLWLCDPAKSEQGKKEDDKLREQRSDDEFNPRSSSGVDVSSGSTGSGKSNDNVIMAQAQSLSEGKIQAVENEQEAPSSLPPNYPIKFQSITSEKNEIEELRQKDEDEPASDETIQSNESPRDLLDTPPSSDRSSGNERNGHKLPNEPYTDPQEDTSSDSPPSSQRAQLTKRNSQDPDPAWILHLLSKLKRQFMRHYVNAMAEFKVRWNLDDNEQLDSMISELKEDVHGRIQTSIDRELRKIKGRAGRPRPPKVAISRDSTEQRRRRLKVMRVESMDTQLQKSDDDLTATGTSFSDQRSDDEFCPCDTCIKKKNENKPEIPAEVRNTAPVMMEFDLRKILQMKKDVPFLSDKVNLTHDVMSVPETEAAETIVGNVIDGALKEVQQKKVSVKADHDHEHEFSTKKCQTILRNDLELYRFSESPNKEGAITETIEDTRHDKTITEEDNMYTATEEDGTSDINFVKAAGKELETMEGKTVKAALAAAIVGLSEADTLVDRRAEESYSDEGVIEQKEHRDEDTAENAGEEDDIEAALAEEQLEKETDLSVALEVVADTYAAKAATEEEQMAEGEDEAAEEDFSEEGSIEGETIAKEKSVHKASADDSEKKTTTAADENTADEENSEKGSATEDEGLREDVSAEEATTKVETGEEALEIAIEETEWEEGSVSEAAVENNNAREDISAEAILTEDESAGEEVLERILANEDSTDKAAEKSVTADFKTAELDDSVQELTAEFESEAEKESESADVADISDKHITEVATADEEAADEEGSVKKSASDDESVIDEDSAESSTVEDKVAGEGDSVDDDTVKILTVKDEFDGQEESDMSGKDLLEATMKNKDGSCEENSAEKGTSDEENIEKEDLAESVSTQVEMAKQEEFKLAAVEDEGGVDSAQTANTDNDESLNGEDCAEEDSVGNESARKEDSIEVVTGEDQSEDESDVATANQSEKESTEAATDDDNTADEDNSATSADETFREEGSAVALTGDKETAVEEDLHEESEKEDDTAGGMDSTEGVTTKNEFSEEKDSAQATAEDENEVKEESGSVTTADISEEETNEADDTTADEEKLAKGFESEEERSEESPGQESEEKGEESPGQESEEEKCEESPGQESEEEKGEESTRQESEEKSEESTGQESEEKGEESPGQESEEEKGEESTGQESEEEKGEESPGQESEEEKGEESPGQESEEEKGEESPGQESEEEKGEESTGQESEEGKCEESTGQESEEEKGEESTGQESGANDEGETEGESFAEAIKEENDSTGNSVDVMSKEDDNLVDEFTVLQDKMDEKEANEGTGHKSKDGSGSVKASEKSTATVTRRADSFVAETPDEKTESGSATEEGSSKSLEAEMEEAQDESDLDENIDMSAGEEQSEEEVEADVLAEAESRGGESEGCTTGDLDAEHESSRGGSEDATSGEESGAMGETSTDVREGETDEAAFSREESGADETVEDRSGDSLTPGESVTAETSREESVEEDGEITSEGSEEAVIRVQDDISEFKADDEAEEEQDKYEDLVEAYEKEEEGIVTANEQAGICIEGTSADGGDEFEDESEQEEDRDNGENNMVSIKVNKPEKESQSAEKIPVTAFDSLIKAQAESDDGAFADFEDSEVEVHHQYNRQKTFKS